MQSAAEWGVDEVERWMLDSGIEGKEQIAQALRAEEVDGATLLALEDKHDVKQGLGVSLNNATMLWEAVVELRDGGNRYMGKGVQGAVDSVNNVFASELMGMDVRPCTLLLYR